MFCFFVGAGTMSATESYLLPKNNLAVPALVDFAAAVGTNVKAGFDGN